MIIEYQHFTYKHDNGFVYVLLNGEWVHSAMSWAEIEKGGREVAAV